MVILGPCQSKKYDTRFEMMALLIPVAKYFGIVLWSRRSVSW